MEDGKHHELSEEVTGTPDEIKRFAAPRKAGEVVEIENIHTKKKFAREIHTVTTHGVTKAREVYEEQSDDYGDNTKIPSARSRSSQEAASDDDDDEPDEPAKKVLSGLPAWGTVLKNYTDELSSTQRVMWVVIVIVGIIAALGLGAALFR
jgi:hypothetical protein